MIDNKHENLLANYDWSFPVPIAYGPGRLREMGEHATNFELTKPLIVTDQGSAGLPFIDTLQQALLSAGIGSEVFAEVAPNPRDSDIVLARNAYLEGGHDSVIAIGGGSGMDAGKSTALTAHNQCDIWQFDFDRDLPSLPADHIFPKLICIPTTAGTGAETESTAMVTHSEPLLG